MKECVVPFLALEGLKELRQLEDEKIFESPQRYFSNWHAFALNFVKDSLIWNLIRSKCMAKARCSCSIGLPGNPPSHSNPNRVPALPIQQVRSNKDASEVRD